VSFLTHSLKIAPVHHVNPNPMPNNGVVVKDVVVVVKSISNS
jgi:hypothetical protein